MLTQCIYLNLVFYSFNGLHIESSCFTEDDKILLGNNNYMVACRSSLIIEKLKAKLVDPNEIQEDWGDK
jgi:hypothetical protein